MRIEVNLDVEKMKIGVIGVGLTKFGELWDKGLRDLLAEAQIKALEDSGLAPEDIDAMFTGNMCGGELSGQEHIAALATQNLGINVPSTRCEGACASGALALRSGLQAIESGQADIVMVNGVEKMTDVSTEQVTTALMGAGDEEWEGFQGLTFPSLYALMATRHMYEYGTTREQLAAVSVKNHKHGAMNPIAQFRKEINLETALNSTMVSYPLTLFDCSPITDGAASLILCKEELVKKYSDSPVYVIGSGQASDSPALAARESLTSMKATKVAAEMAYKMAKVTTKDLNIVEVHDCFTIAEIIAMEGLGITKPGETGKFVQEGNTYFDSKMPVNTCGGLKACGHPIGATGVKQAIEVVEQLRGEAGNRQVKNAQIGLTQNVGGTGATVGVHVFRRG